MGDHELRDDWPQPGDEGYVTPEDTPQARTQLADNRWAASDRERAGSGVHGAPAQGGVTPEVAAARQAAEQPAATPAPAPSRVDAADKPASQPAAAPKSS